MWLSQVDADLAADGLDRDRLWYEVHRRLVHAGIAVPQQQSGGKTPMFPCLGVLVHADQSQVSPPLYIFSIEVFFVQRISLMGAPTANTMRMTWCREAIGDARQDVQGFDWSNVYSTVGSLVDQFLHESLGLLDGEPSAQACN